MKYIVVFDVGGTDIKYGIIAPNEHKLIFKQSFPTYAHIGGARIFDNVIHKVNELKVAYDLIGIGISCAGVINSETGLVLNATNTIPNFIGLNIIETVYQGTNLKTTVENDVNCFALAECRQHPLIKDFVLITLGTGIGGGIVINHNIYRGTSFASGEVGRMYIGDSIWEDTSSVAALVKIAQTNKLPINDGIELFELYDNGHILARNIITDWYMGVAKGISNLIYLFNPEMLTIGGSISNRPTLIDELLPLLHKTCNPIYLKNTRITRATLQSDGGLYGAYYHFINNS